MSNNKKNSFKEKIKMKNSYKNKIKYMKYFLRNYFIPFKYSCNIFMTLCY